MKNLFAIVIVFIMVIVTSCNQETALTDDQKATIKAEVTEQYEKIISNLSTLDMDLWSESWSENDFVSVISGTNYFSTLSEYKDSISTWFSIRDKQTAEILKTDVKVLTSDLAFLSGITDWDIVFKNEMQMNVKLYISMLWKKETDGWKVIQVHESY